MIILRFANTTERSHTHNKTQYTHASGEQ